MTFSQFGGRTRLMALKSTNILCRGKTLALSSTTLVLVGFYLVFFPSDTENSFPPSFRERCRPKRNIVFLKTHKCGSSTVQNILFRYGDAHNLNFVLPLSGHYLGAVIPFTRIMVKGTPWNKLGYNIFTHHTIFNETEIKAIMPNDAIFVSILRNPVSLFESLYNFARFDLAYQTDLEAFIRSGHKPLGHNRKDRISGHLGRNQMLYDLGFNGSNFDNPDKIQEGIQNLDRIFDFILIAEHFDESLVLMKHLLCWTTEDMVYFRQNVRSQNHKHSLSPGTKHLIKDYNAADQMLYDYFLQQFHKRAEEFGKERLEREVLQLRVRNKNWYDFCVEKTSNSSTELKGSSRTWSHQVVGYQVRSSVKNRTCDCLAKTEIPYTDELRLKQILRSRNVAFQKSVNVFRTFEN